MACLVLARKVERGESSLCLCCLDDVRLWSKGESVSVSGENGGNWDASVNLGSVLRARLELGCVAPPIRETVVETGVRRGCTVVAETVVRMDCRAMDCQGRILVAKTTEFELVERKDAGLLPMAAAVVVASENIWM